MLARPPARNRHTFKSALEQQNVYKFSCWAGLRSCARIKELCASSNNIYGKGPASSAFVVLMRARESGHQVFSKYYTPRVFI